MIDKVRTDLMMFMLSSLTNKIDENWMSFNLVYVPGMYSAIWSNNKPGVGSMFQGYAQPSLGGKLKSAAKEVPVKINQKLSINHRNTGVYI